MRTAFTLLLLCAAVAAPAQPVWTQIGPAPNTRGQVEGIADGEIIGAIRSVAAHPSNADILYVGAVNGGIWRTANATAAHPTWVEQLGLGRSLSIGAIEFDPTDATRRTLVAGSGASSSFFTLGGDRIGIWRTTDGGTTWTALDGGGTIAGLNVTGVAPRGAVIVIGADAGVFRSTNSGATWTRISARSGSGLPGGESFDLASDPTSNARLYTNAGSAGVFRSTNSGATWTKVSNAAVDSALAGAVNVRIAVGTRNNVYVAIAGASGRLSALFRFDNGANRWAPLDLPATNETGGPFGIHPGGQARIHFSLAADRANANVVYIGGDRQPAMNEGTNMPSFPNTLGANNYTGRLFRVDASKPRGSQFAHITHSNTKSGSAPHADSRDMVIDAAGNLIETDDGGIYKRTAPLTNTGDWVSLIGDLRVTELHDVAYDGVSKVVLAGAQDGGVPQQIATAGVRWQDVSQGDGGDVAVDDTGTPGMSMRYSSAQNLFNFVRQSFDASNSFHGQVFPAHTVIGGGQPFQAQFVTPVAVNNATPTRLILGGSNSVYESLDQGDTIAEVGAGISVNGGGAIGYGATGNADMLYVGAGDEVFVRSAAAPAPLASSAAYPGRGSGRDVAAIAIRRSDPQSAFAADASHVYRTTNGGATWTEITGNLATLKPGDLLSMVAPDGSVVVGGMNGAFVARAPAFNVWQAVAAGLPRAAVYDLQYNARDQLLVAGLIGRGAWSVTLK